MAADQLVFGNLGPEALVKIVDTSSPNVNTDEVLSTGRWAAVAHDGDGTYVAAQYDFIGTIAVSTDDGATWAESTPSGSGGALIIGTSLVWDGVQFFATTPTGYATSPDGTTWTFTSGNSYGYAYTLKCRDLYFSVGLYAGPSIGVFVSETIDGSVRQQAVGIALGSVGTYGLWYENYRRIAANNDVVVAMPRSTYVAAYCDVSAIELPMDEAPTFTDCTYTDHVSGQTWMRCAAWTGSYWLAAGWVNDSGTRKFALAHSTDGITWEWDYGWGKTNIFPTSILWDGTQFWITAANQDFYADQLYPADPTDSYLFKYAPGSPVLSGTLAQYDPSGDQGSGYIGLAGYPNPALYDHLSATGDGLSVASSAGMRVDTFLSATGDGLNVSAGSAVLSGTNDEDTFVLDFTGVNEDFEIVDGLGSTPVPDQIDFSGLDPSFTVDISHITQTTYLDFREPVRRPFFDVLIEEPIYNRTNYPDGVRRPIRMVLVQPDLTYVGELEGFKLESNIEETLNDIDTIDFRCSVNNNNRDLLTVPDIEVQVWRGTRIAWWGIVETGDTEGEFIKCHAKSLSWYFTRRHFGKANRTNLLLSPRFDEGLKKWNTNTLIMKPEIRLSDGNVPGGVTPQITTGVNDKFDPEYAHGYSQWPNLLGRHSIRISNPNYTDGSFSLFQWYDEFTSTYDQDTLASMTQCIHQLVDVDGGPNGTKCAFVCWLYIPEIVPDYGFSAENPMGSGISLSRMDAAFDPTTDNWFHSILETKSTNVTKTHEKNRWVRHVVELDIPANIECKVWARIEGPYGQFHADACSVTMDEGLENISPEGDDQASLFQRIVEHAQDSDFEKSDLSITTVTPSTPIKRIKKYAYKDHQSTWDALSEYPTLYDGMDFWWIYAPTYRAIATSHPRRGVPRPNLVFELGANISKARIITSGKDTANQIILLSPLGSDSGREEASATDVSIFNGGLTLEKVYTGTPGADIGTLDAQAQRGLARFKDGVVVPEITVSDPKGHLWWEITVGNIHRVKINYGWINVDEDYRIIKKSLDHEASTITLTLNPEFI